VNGPSAMATPDSFSGVSVRLMTRLDILAALSILGESPTASAWSEQGLLESTDSQFAWVAEQSGQVVAFLIARVAADELEILNLAVTASQRRRGIATQLLQTALGSSASGINRVYLEVRESNDAAISLYSRHGFERKGRRPRYYQDPAEDALLLCCEKITAL
jgi:ribosomal-protein-alanine acetyltransferase